ncbi:MAG: FAD-dependent oxidoreductase [Thermodesulfobacteriota bacterium]
MGKHLVLAGAGHAHMVAMANIHELIKLGHKVTVIGPSDYHYYSGMGPGMLGGGYIPDEIRFAVRDKVESQGGRFIRDSVVNIDPARRTLFLASGKSIIYHVVSFNTGSSINKPEIHGDTSRIFTVKPIEDLQKIRLRLLQEAKKRQIFIAVIGGGPAGAEIAGNLRQLIGESGHSSLVLLYTGKRFLGKFPEPVRKKTKKLLLEAGVLFREGDRLESIRDNSLHLQSGARQKVDFVILATGVHPSSFFREAGLPVGSDGGLLVNRNLQCESFPEIFGGGDCISFKDHPLDKVGVYAVRENPVLYENLKACLEGTPLKPFNPGGDYLLVFNLGYGRGVLKKGWLVFSGRTAFRIKDYIDRKFMKKFQ